MAENKDNLNGVFGGINFNGSETNVENNGPVNGVEMHKDNIASNAESYGFFDTTSNAGSYNGTVEDATVFKPIAQEKAITKQGLWTKIRAFLFQELDLNAPIKVELTPYQQKVEDEINDFLHQEITFKGIAKFFSGK